MNNNVLVEIKNLTKIFNKNKNNEIKAIDDVSIKINKGEALGIVGESGCGKSTFGKSIIRLLEVPEETIFFEGKDINKITSRRDSLNLNKRIQMIFQDPYASLNPRLKVMDIVGEGIDIHKLAENKAERNEKIYKLLELVGLNKEHANRYPHEFSGGQRQRIGIARALSVEPDLIIADEPISALDVSIQAQIINIIKKLQKERNTTLLFIAHDLSMVKYVSDRIAVMHKGKIVEIASSERLYQNPLHNYTKSLISAIPQPDPQYERERVREIYKDSFDNNSEYKLREIEKDHFVFTSINKAELLRQRKL
ncbi:TPA: ABC transporter ATP-binding protein [Staphylococcus aureus]|uniref:ABC transporter ATP-binding protein n=1 Tax=Staphylococcus aureus TaxID=1280 RepID=UPI000CD135E6|nr:ATP-binding cassette domain-containing protein [Staphylococcus aureus]HDD0208829.1 ABC transporter ATP-binding protein [Staphylococcus aureus]HDD0322380.1 ABC transporter ATP-binding protein [Staphylococcus aureus]HDD0463963.1 ABC transporter ATP-binding protein [Staphylococcus aureus]HDD0466627.1 ABC transporter ATP-binding protein [Staphylococcus aureus]HDD0477809.1 ABC transporter ATP-binding protein [Staphylococcus aureus]